MLRHLLLAALLVAALPSTAAPFQQVFAGYNGPKDSETVHFTDPESARSSWLSAAIDKAELDALLAEVDFQTNLLAVSAIGERTAVTKVSVESVSWTETSVFLTVFIGVAEKSCPGPRPSSYPFVVAVVARPARYDGVAGYYHQNFPDLCEPVHEGVSSRHAP